MASIIKNQILKHLSKFTKNLSPDKINLSTLKGEGELSNLELDEEILMELLDLPTWMRLKQAVCNKLSIKIQWTNLKSKPICLYLDEVILEVEACEEPRPSNNPAHLASYRSGGKYGFVDRVIDGIYVQINSVSVKFISRQFNATLQLSRVQVRSVTPTWQKATHLGSTKLKDPERGEILVFKEVEWQTTRIEATAVKGESSEQFVTTPLRFIANQSKIRIAIKKKLSDCSIISTRLMLYLDDLLWVLTDTQLKAAILYVNSLKETIEKSRKQSKNLAAEKLLRQGHSSSSPVLPQQRPQPSSTHFSRYDVQTTSYHLITSRIDLHLCDDSSPESGSVHNPDHNIQIEGGAMQVTIHRLSVDIYPYNTAGGERKHWFSYSDNQGSRNHWVQQLFTAFKKDVNKARETCFANSPTQSPAHQPTNQRTPEKLSSAVNQNQSKVNTSPQPPRKNIASNQKPRSTKLLESCTVLKIEEFTIYQVSTADNTRNTPKKFLSSDKKQLHLPSDTSILHAEYTEYFFPEGIDYPVPHANLYVLINPIRLNVDYLTLLWSNYFLLNLAQSMSIGQDTQRPAEHIDIKIEAVMPRMIVCTEEKLGTDTDNPTGIQLQISKLTGSNTRVDEGDTLDDLFNLVNSYDSAKSFHSDIFPNDKSGVITVPKHFDVHANMKDNPYICQYAKDLLTQKLCDILPGVEGGQEALSNLLNTNTLKQNANLDFWSFSADQVWLDFIGVANSRSRPLPFVQAVPLKLWICRPLVIDQYSNSSSHIKSVPNDKKLGNSNKTLASPERQARMLLKKFYSQEENTVNGEINSDNVIDKSSPLDMNGRNAEGGVHTKGSVQTEDSAQAKGSVQSKNLCDINLLVHLGGPIKAQMTHFQYLCLLRVLDSFAVFQLQLTADVNHFDTSSSSPAFRFAIPIMVPELEFAMICPPVMQLLPGNQVEISNDGMSTNDSSSLSDEKSSSQPVTTENEGIEIFPSEEDTLQAHPVITKSLSDSTIQCHMSECSNIQGQIPEVEVTQHIVMYSNSEVNLTSQGQSCSYSSSRTNDSGYGSENKFKSTTAKAHKMKKSFATAMSSLTDKIKTKMDMGDDSSSNADDDSVSIKTDISDEDPDFELLNFEDGEFPVFSHHTNRSETGSETDTQDDLSNMCAELDAAVTKGKEEISVILFKLCKIELILQSDGSDVTARIQSQKLLTTQPGNMRYENFFSTFVSRKGFMHLPTENVQDISSEKFPVKFKLTSGPSVGDICLQHGIPKPTSETSFMDVRAEEFGLKFTNTSLTSLMTFLEDAVSSVAVPMHVDVNRFLLTLQDDAVLENQNTDIPLQTEMMINGLKINRGQDGVFHLTGQAPVGLGIKHVEDTDDTIQENSSEDTLLQKLHIISEENRNLKISLEEMSFKKLKLEEKVDSISLEFSTKCNNLKEENKSLEDQLTKMSQLTNSKIELGISEIENENLKLQEKVLGLEEEVKALSQEKDSLISTLKLMQDELMQSERLHHQRTSST